MSYEGSRGQKCEWGLNSPGRDLKTTVKVVNGWCHKPHLCSMITVPDEYTTDGLLHSLLKSDQFYTVVLFQFQPSHHGITGLILTSGNSFLLINQYLIYNN